MFFFLVSPPTPSWLAPLVEGSPSPLLGWVVSPPLLVGGSLPLVGWERPLLGWAVSLSLCRYGSPFPLLGLVCLLLPFLFGWSPSPSRFGVLPSDFWLDSLPSPFLGCGLPSLFGWVVLPPFLVGGLPPSCWLGRVSPHPFLVWTVSPSFLVASLPACWLGDLPSSFFAPSPCSGSTPLVAWPSPLPCWWGGGGGWVGREGVPQTSPFSGWAVFTSLS